MTLATSPRCIYLQFYPLSLKPLIQLNIFTATLRFLESIMFSLNLPTFAPDIIIGHRIFLCKFHLNLNSYDDKRLLMHSTFHLSSPNSTRYILNLFSCMKKKPKALKKATLRNPVKSTFTLCSCALHKLIQHDENRLNAL